MVWWGVGKSRLRGRVQRRWKVLGKRQRMRRTKRMRVVVVAVVALGLVVAVVRGGGLFGGDGERFGGMILKLTFGDGPEEEGQAKTSWSRPVLGVCGELGAFAIGGLSCKSR